MILLCHLGTHGGNLTHDSAFGLRSLIEKTLAKTFCLPKLVVADVQRPAMNQWFTFGRVTLSFITGSSQVRSPQLSLSRKR